MAFADFWDVTPWILIDIRICGRIYYRHLHSRRNVKYHSSAFKMSVASSFETFVDIYQTTQRHIPEDSDINIDSHQNVSPHTELQVLYRLTNIRESVLLRTDHSSSNLYCNSVTEAHPSLLFTGYREAVSPGTKQQ
jgi:hypothetical protein